MAGRKAHPTRADVARLAGVAPTTVSLILNNHPKVRVADETRKRIHAAARKLNYQPSGVALALVTGRTNSVGVILYHQQNPFGTYTAGILRGFWEVLRDTGMRLVADQPKPGRGVAGLYRERLLDGAVLVAPVQEPDEEVRTAVKYSFPLVQIGSRMPGLAADYVDLDNAAAQHALVAQLLQLGHRKFIYLAGPKDNSSSTDRLAGFTTAMRAAGLHVEPERIMQGNYLTLNGEELARQALSSSTEFTALVAANDAMAIGATRVLRQHGIDIPRQVSVTGINGFCDDDVDQLQLATVVQPLEEIGRQAGKLLLERTGKQRTKPREALVPGALRHGDTMAPPPAA